MSGVAVMIRSNRNVNNVGTELEGGCKANAWIVLANSSEAAGNAELLGPYFAEV